MQSTHEVEYHKTGLPYRVAADPLGLQQPHKIKIRGNLCPCLCGRLLTDSRQRWATPACKQRMYRLRKQVTDQSLNRNTNQNQPD
jgi:hypothetical protein